MDKPVKKKKDNKKKPAQVILPLVLLVVVIGGWELYCRISGISEDILPPPSLVVFSLIKNFKNAFWDAFLYTLRVIVTGYVIAIPTGILFAGVCAQSKILTKIVTPPIIILVTIPMLTLVPLLTLWMGITMKVRIIVVVFQAVPIILLNTLNGFSQVETAKLELFKSMGANRFQLFFKLQLPNALPQVFTGLKLGCIFSSIAAIGADLTAGNFGLGTKISAYSGNLVIEMAFAAIVLVAIVALVMFEIVARIERRVVKWKK